MLGEYVAKFEGTYDDLSTLDNEVSLNCPVLYRTVLTFKLTYMADTY